MLLTPHTLIGLAIAKEIPNPLVSAPLALASHFAADMIPHWDFFTNNHKPVGWRRWAIPADFLVGLILGLVMMASAWPNQTQTFNYGLCAFMACLPDGLEAPNILFDKRWWIAEKSLAWQRFVHFRAQLPWGLVTQLAVATGALLLLLS